MSHPHFQSLDIDHILRLCYTAQDIMPASFRFHSHSAPYTFDLAQLEFFAAPKQSREFFLHTQHFWFTLHALVFAKLPQIDALLLNFAPRAEICTRIKIDSLRETPLHARYAVAVARFYRHILALEDNMPTFNPNDGPLPILNALVDFDARPHLSPAWDSLSRYEIALLVNDLIALLTALERSTLSTE